MKKEQDIISKINEINDEIKEIDLSLKEMSSFQQCASIEPLKKIKLQNDLNILKWILE